MATRSCSRSWSTSMENARLSSGSLLAAASSPTRRSGTRGCSAAGGAPRCARSAGRCAPGDAWDSTEHAPPRWSPRTARWRAARGARTGSSSPAPRCARRPWAAAARRPGSGARCRTRRGPRPRRRWTAGWRPPRGTGCPGCGRRPRGSTAPARCCRPSSPCVPCARGARPRAAPPATAPCTDMGAIAGADAVARRPTRRPSAAIRSRRAPRRLRHDPLRGELGARHVSLKSTRTVSPGRPRAPCSSSTCSRCAAPERHLAPAHLHGRHAQRVATVLAVTAPPPVDGMATLTPSIGRRLPASVARPVNTTSCAPSGSANAAR
jgi:hypothetical protein